jgi:hypothetical protein
MSDFEDVDIKALDYDQLLKHAHHLHTEHAALAKALEAVKQEIGSRTKRPGTRVVGNASVVLSRASRFSDEVAQKKLSKAAYRRICVLKADSTLAKEQLGEDSQAYKDLCVPADNWTVKIGVASTKQKVLDADGKLKDPFEDEAETVEDTD